MHKGTQSELVKELGCSRTAISKLVKNHDYRIIWKNKKRKVIDIEASLKALIDSGFGKRSTPIKKKNESNENGKPGEAQEPEEDIQEYIDGKKKIDLSTPSYIINRWKEIQKADKDRIQNETALGKLIDVDEVGEKSFALWRQVRDGIQAIKDRCAVKVISAQTVHDVEQILEQESHNILSSIVEKYEKLDDETLKKKLVISLTP